MCRLCCCRQGCVRKCLIGYNILYWFCGPALLGVSIWFYISIQEYPWYVGVAQYKSPCYILMVCGSAAVLIGILGCLGSVNENKHIICLFGTLMVFSFGAEVYSVVTLFNIYDMTETYITNRLNLAMSQSVDGDGNVVDEIDRIQINLQCCGTTNYTDWDKYITNFDHRSSKFLLSNGRSYPSSCFSTVSLDTGHIANNTSISTVPFEIFSDGCAMKLTELTKLQILILGWSSFANATLQLIGIVLSCCTYKVIKDSYG